jgi:hypothetical protein
MSVNAAVREVQRRELAPIIKAQVERDRRELQELADEINPPDFDPVENADQVRQRGEFTRLCTDLAKLPSPAQFITRHDGKLRPHRASTGGAGLADGLLRGVEGEVMSRDTDLQGSAHNPTSKTGLKDLRATA